MVYRITFYQLSNGQPVKELESFEPFQVSELERERRRLHDALRRQIGIRLSIEYLEQGSLFAI
jgi:hypothetical protein